MVDNPNQQKPSIPIANQTTYNPQKPQGPTLADVLEQRRLRLTDTLLGPRENALLSREEESKEKYL